MKFNVPTKLDFEPVSITIETEEEFMLFYRLLGGMKSDVKAKFCETFPLYSALGDHLLNLPNLKTDKYPNITLEIRQDHFS